MIQSYNNPSNLIEKYNEQAVLSKQSLTKTLTGHLQKLKEILPVGETVIELGTKHQLNNKQVHQVAVIYFNKPNEGKTNALVTVYKYNELNPAYQNFLSIQSSNSLVVDQPNQLAPVNASYQKVELAAYKIISTETINHLNANDASLRCPSAIKVVKFLNQVFKDGFSLPSINAELTKGHFTVMTKSFGAIEKLSSYQGFNPHNLFLSTGVENATQEAYPDGYEKLDREFSNLTLSAEGKMLPRCIEHANPDQVQQVTLNAQMIASNQQQSLLKLK